MNTKLQQFEHPSKLPAGLLSGTEAFWHDNEKWIVQEGSVMKFSEAPASLQRMIANQFLNDKQSTALLKSEGITGFSEAFERWYRCVVGALDGVADFENDRLNPDTYNHSCSDLNCSLRGRLCSRQVGLKYYEVATIAALKGGFNESQTAKLLCISVPGLKSRIEKIKEKLGATNMASMIARGVEFGI